MIIIRHSEECAGKPNLVGRLTGTCDCKTAPLDESALQLLEQLLDQLAAASTAAAEPSDYLALRLEGLAERAERDARNVRRRTVRTAARAAETAEDVP